MISGVHDIYYNVKDMKRAVEFYTKTLNMTVSWESDHWSSLDCGGVMIGLHWTEGSDVPSFPRDSHGAQCGGTLTLKSDDVSKDRKILEDAGANILGEVDADWGHMLVFEDLDGNVLKLQNAKY
ncbi:VOC family protein [Halobacteriovorax sp. HLS]|uniref:VOC family protein n=1 Tax=Halobacteriovorax sp. HLS TaxID=2234000 RepID=UPI000FD89906|nr:VOC family protein [Halobacteriovorax sp. HLS]